jgi:hypothetical protein
LFFLILNFTYANTFFDLNPITNYQEDRLEDSIPDDSFVRKRFGLKKINTTSMLEPSAYDQLMYGDLRGLQKETAFIIHSLGKIYLLSLKVEEDEFTNNLSVWNVYYYDKEKSTFVYSHEILGPKMISPQIFQLHKSTIKIHQRCYVDYIRHLYSIPLIKINLLELFAHNIYSKNTSEIIDEEEKQRFLIYSSYSMDLKEMQNHHITYLHCLYVEMALIGIEAIKMERDSLAKILAEEVTIRKEISRSFQACAYSLSSAWQQNDVPPECTMLDPTVVRFSPFNWAQRTPCFVQPNYALHIFYKNCIKYRGLPQEVIIMIFSFLLPINSALFISHIFDIECVKSDLERQSIIDRMEEFHKFLQFE